MENFDLTYSFVRAIVGLIIAIIFGFVGKTIMEKKGRSGAGGFALGFFFSLLGVIICALMSESTERIMVRTQMMQRGYPPSAFPGVMPPQPMQSYAPVPPVPMQAAATQACKSCGAATIPGAAFCPSCGTKV